MGGEQNVCPVMTPRQASFISKMRVVRPCARTVCNAAHIAFWKIARPKNRWLIGWETVMRVITLAVLTCGTAVSVRGYATRKHVLQADNGAG